MIARLLVSFVLVFALAAALEAQGPSLFERLGGATPGGDPAEATPADEDLEALAESLVAAERYLEASEPPPELDPILERRVEDFVTPVPERPSFPYAEFRYDGGTPTIHCIPGRVCSVELEVGEAVRATAMGDVHRWLVTQLPAGGDGDRRTVLAFMPRVFGISTNVLVTTDRRIYVLELRSGYPDADEHPENALALTERARFSYPERWAVEHALPDPPPAALVPEPSAEEAPAFDPASVRFRYRMVKPWRKALPWQPTAVFDDGTFAYVVLPRVEVLPAVRGIDRATGQPYALNEIYRTGGRQPYIEIPRLPGKFELFLGAGSKRRSITFVRQGGE